MDLIRVADRVEPAVLIGRGGGAPELGYYVSMLVRQFARQMGED